jgi:glutamate 5-kinase
MHVMSRLTVDDGAVAAVREPGASLLAVGVPEWSDDFHVGDGQVGASTRFSLCIGAFVARAVRCKYSIR